MTKTKSRYLYIICILLLVLAAANLFVMHLQKSNFEKFLSKEHDFKFAKLKLQCDSFENKSYFFWQYKAIAHNCKINIRHLLSTKKQSDKTDYFLFPAIDYVENFASKTATLSFDSVEQYSSELEKNITITSPKMIKLQLFRDAYIGTINNVKFDIEADDLNVFNRSFDIDFYTIKDFIISLIYSNNREKKEIGLKLLGDINITDALNQLLKKQNKTQDDSSELADLLSEKKYFFEAFQDVIFNIDLAIIFDKYTQEEIDQISQEYKDKHNLRLNSDYTKSMRYKINHLDMKSQLFDIGFSGDLLKEAKPGLPAFNLIFTIRNVSKAFEYLREEFEYNIQKEGLGILIDKLRPDLIAQALIKVLQDSNLIVGDDINLEIVSDGKSFPTIQKISIFDLYKNYIIEFTRLKNLEYTSGR